MTSDIVFAASDLLHPAVEGCLCLPSLVGKKVSRMKSICPIQLSKSLPSLNHHPHVLFDDLGYCFWCVRPSTSSSWGCLCLPSSLGRKMKSFVRGDVKHCIWLGMKFNKTLKCTLYTTTELHYSQEHISILTQTNWISLSPQLTPQKACSEL